MEDFPAPPAITSLFTPGLKYTGMKCNCLFLFPPVRFSKTNNFRSYLLVEHHVFYILNAWSKMVVIHIKIPY